MRDIMKMITFEVAGEERSFQLRKMNPFDGAALLKFVSEKIIPMVQKALNMDEEKENFDVNIQVLGDLLPNLLKSISNSELKELMVTCLQTVYVPLPAGYQAVVDSRGNFGIEDLAYDTATCLRLTYEAIMYNCSGFFSESGLSSLLAGRTGSQPEQ